MIAKILIVLVLTAFLLPVSAADAQQETKMPKVGRLAASSSVTSSGTRPLFMRELDKLGYVDGKNIAIESRHADNPLDRLPARAAELVRLKVERGLTDKNPK